MFDKRTLFSNKPAACPKAQVQGKMMTAAFDGLFASLTGQAGLFVSDFLIVKKSLFNQIKYIKLVYICKIRLRFHSFVLLLIQRWHLMQHLNKM